MTRLASVAAHDSERGMAEEGLLTVGDRVVRLRRTVWAVPTSLPARPQNKSVALLDGGEKKSRPMFLGVREKTGISYPEKSGISSAGRVDKKRRIMI